MQNNAVRNIIILIVSLLCQVVLFKYMQIAYTFNIFFFLLFILSLPVSIKKLPLLLLSAFSGYLADLLLGTGGIMTIVSVLAGYIRPFLVPLFYVADDWSEKGSPSSSLMRPGSYIFYVFIILFTSSLLYYITENLSFNGFGVILKKSFISTIITIPFIYFAQLLIFRTKVRR